MITIVAAFIITTFMVMVMCKFGLISKSYKSYLWQPGKENLISNILSVIAHLITYGVLVYVVWYAIETTIRDMY